MIAQSGASVRRGADEEARDRPRSASASPTGRSAAACRRRALRAARATARDARRACSARARGFRRRSPCASSPASCGRIPSRAGCRAIPAWSRRCAAAAAHRCALGGRRVAGAHPGADVDVGQAERLQLLARCRRAAPRDCAGCRSTAPSAARRRRSGFRRRAARRVPAAPARRSRRETPRASCPIRSARRSAHGGRPGSPATPPPAPRSARRSCARTRRRPRDEKGSASPPAADRRGARGNPRRRAGAAGGRRLRSQGGKRARQGAILLGRRFGAVGRASREYMGARPVLVRRSGSRRQAGWRVGAQPPPPRFAWTTSPRKRGRIS